MNLRDKITRISRLEIILIVIPSIAFASLLAFIGWNKITMEAFWSNLTYFLLGGIFFPLATLITLRVKHHYNEEKHNEYNIKKLNDEVFRKLMRVVCLEYYPFFENRFDFCIPKDPEIFKIKPNAWSIAFMIRFDKNINIENSFDKLSDVIKTLEIGEKYLQQNYVKIYDDWMKIKKELDVLNRHRISFLESISQKIVKKLMKQFGSRHRTMLVPFDDSWAYFYQNVPKIIPLLFENLHIKFTTDNPANTLFYVNYGGYRILGFNKEEKLDMNFIEYVFDQIVHDFKIEEKEREYINKLFELNNKIDSFCNQLEKLVVNDIDNMT